jgi:hypothetical protein
LAQKARVTGHWKAEKWKPEVQNQGKMKWWWVIDFYHCCWPKFNLLIIILCDKSCYLKLGNFSFVIGKMIRSIQTWSKPIAFFSQFHPTVILGFRHSNIIAFYNLELVLWYQTTKI